MSVLAGLVNSSDALKSSIRITWKAEVMMLLSTAIAAISSLDNPSRTAWTAGSRICTIRIGLGFRAAAFHH